MTGDVMRDVRETGAGLWQPTVVSRAGPWLCITKGASVQAPVRAPTRLARQAPESSAHPRGAAAARTVLETQTGKRDTQPPRLAMPSFASYGLGCAIPRGGHTRKETASPPGTSSPPLGHPTRLSRRGVPAVCIVLALLGIIAAPCSAFVPSPPGSLSIQNPKPEPNLNPQI